MIHFRCLFIENLLLSVSGEFTSIVAVLILTYLVNNTLIFDFVTQSEHFWSERTQHCDVSCVSWQYSKAVSPSPLKKSGIVKWSLTSVVRYIVENYIFGAPFGSVGRARVPCAEALQRTWVRLPAWVPLLRVTLSLSCHIFSCSIIRGQKERK